MQIRKNTVAEMDGVPAVVDLADFPHGELSSVRKDDDYDIEFYEVPEGVLVPAYDEKSGTAVMRQVKYWSIHRGKKVEIVNLDDGRQIITDNDPRAVYGVPCDSGDVVPRRFTPSEAMDRHVLVPVVDDALADGLEGMFYCFGDGMICGERKPNSACVGFELGQFVGIMAGDGWDSSGKQVWISDNEGFNKEFAEAFLKGIFPGMSCVSYAQKADSDSQRYGNTVAHRFNVGTQSFADRIKELVDGHGDESTSGSANKRLPIWYQFAGKDFIMGLVNGLIATDGAVSVSHAKAKPQLQISFTSTSLRLAREFRRCCQLLGVRASISFCKHTSGGNEAWICSVSTTDAKKAGLLDRCCHARKRDVFLNTYVDLSDRSTRNDIIPFPKGVAERLVPLVPSAKTSGVDLDALGEEEKSRRMKRQSIAVNVRNHGKLGYITRGLVRAIRDLGEEIAAGNIRAFERGNALIADVERRFDGLLAHDDGGSRRSWKVPMSVSEADGMAAMIASVKPRFCDGWMASLGNATNALSSIRKKGFVTWSQLSDIRNVFLRHGRPNTELRDSRDLADLVRLTESNVTWVRIRSVEKTGKVEVGYDLTVPGPDTFVSDDGIVLSNTVNIHVPATDKAAKQALDRMLPSKNLISLTDLKSVRYRPEKEQISGLWALTEAPAAKPVRRFGSKAEAVKAYRNGEIGPNDPIEIG